MSIRFILREPRRDVLTFIFKFLATIDFEFFMEDKKPQFQTPVLRTISGDIEPDPETDEFVQQALAPLDNPALKRKLAMVETTLDGRFLSIRTQETGLGNLVCDARKFCYLSI